MAATPTWPFTYETSAAAITETLADYARTLEIERRSLARALKLGDRTMAAGFRRGIERFEAASRAGRVRLRELGGVQAEGC